MNILGLALAVTLACQPVPDAGQSGFWEAVETSMGGIGNNIEFRADGSYSRAMTVMVDFVYELEDSVLHTSLDNGEPNSKTHSTGIRLTDESYIVFRENGEEVRPQLGEGEPDSIVGIYSYRHNTGAIAYEKFTADGKFLLRIPMRVERGCFSIEREQITLEPQDGEAYKTNFRIESGQLVLDDLKRVSAYRPVTEGAWYHVDEVDYVKPKRFDMED